MPASGLLALLDDIASIADDVAVLSSAAAKKSVGIVTDDMAVTAEQAIGIRREREIPVALAVARGSFRNKALILAPAALLLNAVAPWAITPLLMLGGSYLAFEGVEKVLHLQRGGVYGVVAVLIKLDDLGELLFRFGGRRRWLGKPDSRYPGSSAPGSTCWPGASSGPCWSAS